MEFLLSQIRQGTDPYIMSVLDECVAAGAKTLEAGCGLGLLSLDLALTRGTKATLLDIDTKTLAKANAFFSHFNMKATLKEGDVQDLPFGDDTFDLVFNEGVLEHHPINLRKAVNEMLRVSKRFVVIALPDGSSWKYKVKKYAKRIMGEFTCDCYGYERNVTEAWFKGFNYTKRTIPFHNVVYVLEKKRQAPFERKSSAARGH